MRNPLRIVNGFNKMIDGLLLAQAHSIHRNMSAHPDYFPGPIPTMAAFFAGIESFQLAVNHASGGDKNKILAREAEKEKLVDMLHLLSYYVLFSSGGNPFIVTESGYTLAKNFTSLPEMPAPGPVRLTLGDQSGVLHAKVKHVRGAVAYMHQHTTDPSLSEDSWENVLGSTAAYTFTGLTPGTMYYVRVGAIGRKRQVKFSPVTNRMVV